MFVIIPEVISRLVPESKIPDLLCRIHVFEEGLEFLNLVGCIVEPFEVRGWLGSQYGVTGTSAGMIRVNCFETISTCS